MTFLNRNGTSIAAAACVAAVAFAHSAIAEQRGVSDTEIVVGTHQPMSGPLASWGTQVVNGIQMRIDEANATGGINGRKIKLIVEDSQFDPARAAQVGNKLIEKDRVFVILGALGTTTNLVVMPRAFEANVPNLFPVAAGRQMYEPFNRLAFAAATPHYDNMRVAIKYMVEKKNKKQICTLTQDNEFGKEVHAGVVAQLDAMKLKLAGEATHRARDNDFSTQIAKLREANCDLVVLGAVVTDTVFPMATARRLGWDVDFLGSSSSYAPENILLAKGATEGLYATAQMEIPTEKSDKPAVQKFAAAYQKSFNGPAGFQAAIAYTYTDLFLLAVKNAGKNLTTDSLVAALEAVKDYEDPFKSGPKLTFGPKLRLGTTASFISQVQKGQWVKITDVLTYQ